ncbi:MAG: hypothetical protein ABSG25_03820 [Bryobacteraceae bacterium]
MEIRWFGQALRWLILGAVCAWLVPGAFAAAFGTVVPVRGLPSDIALDAARGVVYVANMSAQQVDVVSTQSQTIVNSFPIGVPSSLALSPDGRYLLVAQYPNWTPPTPPSGTGPFQPPATPSPTPNPNASPSPSPSCSPLPNLTSIDLTGVKPPQQWIGCPGLGVRFGNDGKALLITTNDLDMVDPVAGTEQFLDSIYGLVSLQLPQLAPQFPKQFTEAGMGVSGDGNHIFATVSAGGSQTIEIQYYVPLGYIPFENPLAYFSSSTPPPGPRVVSVNQDGSLYMEDWVLISQSAGLQAQLPNTTGTFAYGTGLLDPIRNLVYVQAQLATPQVGAQTTQSILQVLDADNLTLREQLQLPENLIGTSVLDATGNIMYAASDSGLMILPVGSLLPATLLPQPLPNSVVYPQPAGSLPPTASSPLPRQPLPQAPQVFSSQEDLFFGGTFCNQHMVTETFNITDTSGGNSDFTLATAMTGVTISPLTGTTPATVSVTVDMSQYAATMGTSQGLIAITSNAAVNVPPPVRILINTPQPDQRGGIFDVPGTLVDLLADPFRNRFYVTRQDKNEVLVFDGSSYQLTNILRTGNTPMQLAISPDGKYLLTTADNSGGAKQFDLNALQFVQYIEFFDSIDDPGAHYPHSIAFSNGQILAASRVAGAWSQIDSIDLVSGTAQPFPNPSNSSPGTTSLGIWKNDVSSNTVLTASPSGNSIFAAEDNGAVLLYDATANTFVYARQDLTGLAGPYAALSDSTFVVDNSVLDTGLIVQNTLESASGSPSGFSAFAPLTLRTTTPGSASPGIIQKFDPATWESDGPIRMVESPLLGTTIATYTTPTTASAYPFTRTLAPLFFNGNAIIALTTSGLTVLPWTYDLQPAAPVINRVVNAADFTNAVAPGSVIEIRGSNLSAITASAPSLPASMPTVLGGSCALADGILIPISFASPGQINGQWPFEIDTPATVVLYTPNGVSNAFPVNVTAQAPAVFSTAIPGWQGLIPSVVRSSNGLTSTLSNPIHENDWITIFVTGLGDTSPSVGDGQPSPANPLAEAVLPTVTLGNSALEVTSATLVPGQVGVYQIVAHVPMKGVQLGMSVPLTIAAGTVSATVDVRVVN